MSQEDPPTEATEDTDPPARRWGERLAWLHLSGWLPAAVVSFAVCVPVLGGEAILASVAIALLFTSINASLFALSVGPWLGPWRRSLSQSFPYGVLTALLGLLLVGWTAITLSAFPLLGARLVGGVDSSGNLGHQALAALDMVLNEGGALGWALVWLIAVAACLGGREIARNHPASIYAESAGRKLLGTALLTPYLLLLGQAALVVWQGGRLAPDFRQAYGPDIEAALQQPADPLRDQLPASFGRLPQVVAWLNGASAFDSLVPPKPDWKTIFPAWLKEVRRLWGDSPDRWKNPELQALAQVARRESLLSSSKGVDPALRAELAIRSQVLLLDRGGVSSTQAQRLFELELPAPVWGALVALALSPPGLEHGAVLSDDILREEFADEGAAVARRTDRDLDGNKQWNLFARCLERARLNHRWREYQRGKPYVEPATPLNRQQFAERYAPSLEFRLDDIDADIGQFTFSNDLARQELAYVAVMMELKRLEAEGAALPQTWADFRPEVAALARAYSDWMRLTPVPGGVDLRRPEIRGGLGLAHHFRQGAP